MTIKASPFNEQEEMDLLDFLKAGHYDGSNEAITRDVYWKNRVVFKTIGPYLNSNTELCMNVGN